MREMPHHASLVAVLVTLCGCESFEPRPLEERELLEELRSIRLEDLEIRGEEGPRPGDASFEFDAALGIAREEAVAVALFLNPGIRSFRKERGVAEGEVVEAGLLPNPELQVTWLYIGHFTRSFATSGFDIALNWAPPRPGEQRAKIAKARARLDAVRSEVAGAEWTLAAEVRSAFTAVQAGEERLATADTSLKLEDKIRDFVRERARLGDANRMDLNLTEIAYAEVARGREMVAIELERARRELRRLLGLPPDYELKLRDAEDLAYRAIPIEPGTLESSMLDRRPELVTAKKLYEESEENLRLAYIQRWPWFRFGPAYSRDEIDGQAGNRFGLGLGIDLPLANQNQGVIAIREAERERLRAAFTAALHQGRAEVAEAFRDLKAEERLIRLYEETIRPALEESVQLAETGIESREFNLLQMITTQEKVLRARREHIEALLRYWKAAFDLERALGASIPGVTGLPGVTELEDGTNRKDS